MHCDDKRTLFVLKEQIKKTWDLLKESDFKDKDLLKMLNDIILDYTECQKES
ncbi:MAG: hypothetical protein K5790_03345 [Nitrosopumilus sp.]|uniref:hypothetical protein n=1 Tax=Nitrosopumilus sp. TaxID=2024843 RepID=UPI00247D5C02|nr:hypothetical protein [Nitrosopumilus sp.]MCV0392313.1 hypothetical protein [Nitrosopumilus sp.]